MGISASVDVINCRSDLVVVTVSQCGADRLYTILPRNAPIYAFIKSEYVLGRVRRTGSCNKSIVMYRPGGGNLLQYVRTGRVLTKTQWQDLWRLAKASKYKSVNISGYLSDRDEECLDILMRAYKKTCQ